MSQTETLRQRLLTLQNAIQENVLEQQVSHTHDELSHLAEITKADAIYQIDKVSEDFVLEWFAANWPKEEPVELLMEGIEDGTTTFPKGTPIEDTHFVCILDPIDGTRCLMDDKRSGWVLTAIAPRTSRTRKPTLKDIIVAAMTELPASKQRLADQLSGIRGLGPAGIVTTRCNLDTGLSSPIQLKPSKATDLKHGHAIVAKFFPEAKGLLTEFEETLLDRLYGLGKTTYPLVFDDQYPSTGGQFYELMAGRDRMVLDLRPLAFHKTGFDKCLAAHPYDICTSLLLKESGCPITGMHAQPLDYPLDTTTSCGFLAYANPTLQKTLQPLIQVLIAELLD